MEIKTVSIIGLGALGTMYGHYLSKRTGGLRIIANAERIERYTRQGVYSNGEKCEFHYLKPGEGGPADLLIFAVKQYGLESAIRDAKSQVGEHTIVLSLLNGIVSEQTIGEAYGEEHMLLCVGQGMDAVMQNGHLNYKYMGLLCFGDREKGVVSEKTKSVARFFDSVELPYEINTDMQRRQWGKFMTNVGVNQTVAAMGECYGDIQHEGPVRNVMIAAMEEVLILAELEGIGLTRDDLFYWLGILDGLNPEGKPSMRQDVEAKRPTEVELFSGTVVALGQKHGLETPVNSELYSRIRAIEKAYGNPAKP